MQERKKFLKDQGYLFVRQLPDGRWIGAHPMITTTGLFVDLDDTGYDYRYCYHSLSEAFLAVQHWDGVDHPPGNWIVRKPGDYHNPNYRQVS
jgi:hypothetical protein